MNPQENIPYIPLLYNILCSQKPAYKEIVTILLKEFDSFLYAILERPDIVKTYHIVSSNELSFSITDDILFSANSFTLKNYDSPIVFHNISGIKGIVIVPINSTNILFLCSHNCYSEEKMTVQNLNPFLQAFNYLLQRFEVDPDFFIARTESFSDDLMTQLSQRSFNIFNYHPSDLFRYTFAMFHRSGISSKIGINPHDLLEFLIEIRHHYNQVPYHNWFHALDVTQFVFFIATKVQLNDICNDTEIFALLLSAISHDTEHNGLTNNYHRNTHSLFAHLASDMPPLEHHHSEMAIYLSKRMLSKFDEAKRDDIGHFIINCIMATNMEIHKQFLTDFKEVQKHFDKNNNEHRLLLAQIILKAADLSNTVRDFECAESMSTKLQTESFRQGDFEEAKGLPKSPMCDRNSKDPLCKGQVGFYKFVAGPFMNELHNFFPNLSENAQQFESNLNHWEELLNLSSSS